MNDQIQRLRDILQLQDKKKNTDEAEILAITSGKGGTGKTFLSINLAFALSQFHKKVLLIDMDTNLSGLNILLNIYPNKTLINFFNEETTFERIIYQHNENFHIIFGDSGRFDYPHINSLNIKGMLKEIKKIREYYDFIIFDTGAGVGEEVLNLLEICDKIVLVVNPEPTSIMDAYVVVKLLSVLTNKIKVFTIINKAHGLKEGQTAFENLNTAINHFLKKEVELLGIVETDDGVHKSIMEQQILMVESPYNKVSEAIKKVALTLTR